MSVVMDLLTVHMAFLLRKEQNFLQLPTQVTAMLYEIDISGQLRKCLDQIYIEINQRIIKLQSPMVKLLAKTQFSKLQNFFE